MFVEILIYTQPADFYCHLSAINVSNDRLFTIYSRFHPLSLIQFQVRRTDLTIISDRHVKNVTSTSHRCISMGAVLFPGCVNYIVGFGGNRRGALVLLGPGRCSSTEQLSPCDVSVRGNTKSRHVFFRLCNDFRRQPSLKIS